MRNSFRNKDGQLTGLGRKAKTAAIAAVTKRLRVKSTVVGVLALVLALPNIALADYPPPSLLAAQWWQWAVDTPASENPVTDTTGEFADVGQRGPVWFLAGNRDGGTTVRTITLPLGKALFFPIVNYFLAGEGTVRYERGVCDAIIDGASGLACEVDGSPVPITEAANREQSTPFTLRVPVDNIYGAPSGTYAPAVDDGYYVLLAPLAAGEDSIHFAGSLPGFSLDVTYYITVQ